MPSAARLANLAEAFVLTWSSMPADLPERISASQLRALVVIRRSGGTTVSELARSLGALPSSATRLCDRLVAAGYIERAPARDNRRFHAVSLSDTGERLLEALDTHRAQALETVLERMTPGDRTALAVGLHAFAAGAALEPVVQPEPAEGPVAEDGLEPGDRSPAGPQPGVGSAGPAPERPAPSLVTGSAATRPSAATADREAFAPTGELRLG
jgi:DNA-binding MarR family transcriptional regulator